MSDTSRTYSIGEAAEAVGIKDWQVRSLERRGLIPEPSRCGRQRSYCDADVKSIEKAAKAAGYLK